MFTVSLLVNMSLPLPLTITSKRSSCWHNERVESVIFPLFSCIHTQREDLLTDRCSQHFYSLHTLSWVHGWVTQMSYRISCVWVAVSLRFHVLFHTYTLHCIYSIASGKQWKLTARKGKGRSGEMGRWVWGKKNKSESSARRRVKMQVNVIRMIRKRGGEIVEGFLYNMQSRPTEIKHFNECAVACQRRMDL